ncbi:uncharacterized protein [Battus philenor]|uniref:uncharacterized protein isoform X8 n=1 Tax=Battus philenor TaxID=42288 RepID=UPI0035CFE81E
MDENSSVTSSIDLSKINNDLSNLILDNESSRSTNKLEDMSEKGNLSELMNTERNELSYYDFYKAVEENLNKLDGYNKEPANNDTNLTMSNLNDIVSCNGHVPLQNTEESDFLKNCMIEVGNGVLSKLGIEDGTQLINPNEAITDDMTYDGCITLQKQSNKVFKESMVVAPDNPVENTIKELRIEDSTKIMNTDISKLTKNVENSNVSELPNEDSGLTSYEELSSVSLMKTPKFSPITKPDEIEDQNEGTSLQKQKEPTLEDHNPSNKLLCAISKPLTDTSSSESSMDETSTKSTNTSCERSISPSAERTDSGLEENVTTENQSPSITTKSCHSSDEPNSPVEKTAPSCVQENATAVVKEQACNIVNSYHSSIERIEPRTKLKTTIQFQPGGQPESPNERNEIESIEPSTSMTMNTPPNQQHCFRGRSLDRRTDSMKSKLVEGLSVPLECEKAKRMMQLMGWNGGGLGTRGEGITEPIMPALGIVSGAGLGHNNYAPNNFMNVPPYPGSVYSGDIFDEMSFVDPWTKSWRIKQDTETRLYILSNLLDFVSSYERHKVLTFHVPLVSSEINFLYPVIRSLNEGTFVALETNYERTMFYKIQNAMMGTTEIQLAATILTGGREIQLSKVYEDNGNMVTEVEYYDCPRKCLSVEVYMIGLRSIKDYVFYSSKSFRSFAFRHMMLQEILEFVESDEIAIYYDFVGSLHKKQLRFLYVFFENLNIRQREKALTPHEDLVTEQIYNKLGDYYLNLDIISHHKQIKLQKKYRNKRDYKKRVSSNNTYIKKDVWANNEIKQCITKNVAVQCIEAEFRQYQILKMREDGTKKAKDRQKDVLQDIKEKNKQKENKECKNEDIKKPDSEKEAEGLKKDIEGLQASIAKVDCICKTDKNKCKINELKIFREIYLKSTNEQEIITVNSVRFIQKLISDAIDACDNFLPLLQCHGIVDDKLFYSCYNEETYSWIKTVIGDKFIITDSAMQSGSSHRLQMKIKSFIDYDTAKILNTVKLYNPELDLSGWTVEKKIISIDFILIDIEVDSVSYNFISQCNFSLFMGIDRAQFSVIWN